ncbi:kinesin-like protein KIF2A isoform X3 [Dreissena polymorpha]|uniref:kinesin-like protein KIF2A isoform X3 n=1 Tax=Dreissena polymorpha TaxID=45954 RepID=UPI0022646D90|nr:kinesin-like protein KIF2A isoform X3 [Dreissena polymorpha]
MDLSHLKVGVNVDIQRTDGRIHSAVISGVNNDAKSVTVEWFERGETKGKEIEADAIFSLNPHLMQENQKPGARDTHSSQSQNDNDDDDDYTYGSVSPVDQAPPAEGKGRGKKSNRVSAANAQETPRLSNRVSSSSSKVGSARSRQSYATRPPATQQNQQNGQNGQNGQAEPAESKKPGIPVADRRKSNCVKEVERIEQRRKERREKQVAIKEQMDGDYDTSDPNWQFAAMIKEFRAHLDYRPLTSSDPIVNHQICVCVRIRPLNKKEQGKKEVSVITVPNKETVIVHEPKTKVDLTKYLENQNFRFDYAFDENSSNEMVYRYTAKPLVDCIFENGMATCFAYGQTGSGKTHTMGGDFTGGKGQQETAKGIYCLAARDVFKLIHTKYKKSELTVGSSFFEIYSGKVFDLLNKKQKLRVLEDHKGQVQVVGLKEEVINSADDVLRLVAHGTNVRTSGVTSANQHSSRSHAVFQIILRKKSTGKLHGKFSLIDLAGNERGQDTKSSDRQTRMEGAEINKSLLALKECIRALGRKAGAYLPFRASKLTQVLRDSFIGDNSRTCMISMISPGMGCCEHSLNTLRYADRVKELGPGGPVEGKPAEIDLSGHYNNLGAMSPQNSALALLRTTNQDEVSDEMMTFHEKVNHMQELEEEIIDDQKSLIDNTQKWLTEQKKLLKQSDEVDYDVEAYAKQLDALLGSKIEELVKLKEKVANFRADIQEEETLSKNMKANKKK